MTGFAPKTYQSQVLESIAAYFESCHAQRAPSRAFTATTERLWGRGLAYNPLSGFPSDMLARFHPGGVMELTATADLERTPSNVLHSASAAELKTEEMIKLRVVLEALLP